MKILLYSSLLDNSPGGINSWTKSYIKFFKSSQVLECTLVNNAIIGKRATNFEKYYFFTEIKRSSRIKKQFKKALDNNSYDLVHFNSACSAFGILRDYSYVKMIAKKGIPFIIHFHCDVEFQINKWPKMFRHCASVKLKQILNKASEIIVLNKKSYYFLKNHFGFESKVLPNFVDSDVYSEKERNINPVVKNVLFVGHAIKEKGIYELIEAARKLPNIIFWIIGEASNEIIDYAKNVANISLIGIKPHAVVAEYLLNADVFILPSYSEGFSLALLEAMAAGTPCIASDVGANEEMLENYGGLIMKSITSNEIIRCILCMKDRDFRIKMSKWNVEKVTRYYSVDFVMKSLTNIYRSIVD